jgi:hypothetical protein
MNDQLYERLQAVDPARHGDDRVPDEAWIDELARTTMGADRPTGARRRLVVPLAVAAATTLIVGGAVTATVVIGADHASHPGDSVAATKPPLKTIPPLRLRVPSPLVGSSCIVFSVDYLAEMPVAFSGTVASVGAHTVTLDVDHWYRGGDQAQVEIGTMDGSSIALEGIPEFAAGERYLITATNGTVNACGFSVPWSSDMAGIFANAFE